MASVKRWDRRQYDALGWSTGLIPAPEWGGLFSMGTARSASAVTPSTLIRTEFSPYVNVTVNPGVGETPLEGSWAFVNMWAVMWWQADGFSATYPPNGKHDPAYLGTFPLVPTYDNNVSAGFYTVRWGLPDVTEKNFGMRRQPSTVTARAGVWMALAFVDYQDFFRLSNPWAGQIVHRGSTLAALWGTAT